MGFLVEDVFQAYIRNEVYIEDEKTNLLQHFHSELADFLAYKQKRKAHKGVFKKAEGDALDARLSRAINSFDEKTAGQGDPGLNILSVETALNLIHVLELSIKRAEKLSSPPHTATNVGSLHEILLTALGRDYLAPALEFTLEDMVWSEAKMGVLDAKPGDPKPASLDSKSVPFLRYLEVVQASSSIVHLLQKNFQHFVLSHVVENQGAYRQCMIIKNAVFLVLENLICSLLAKFISGLVSWLAKTLSKQKKTDYRIKENSSMSNSPLSATPCGSCIEFLRLVHRCATKVLDGKNLDMFLFELGSRFHLLLMEHIKKFVFTNLGGLTLATELTTYQDCIKSFGIPQLNEKFEQLRQIGNLFIVRPENIKTLLEEGVLSRMDQRQLHSYIQMRADYKTEKISAYFQAAPPPPPSHWKDI